jgi:catechol 2,3-dioxygenase-like lactoylglutathione lyase family enzyme
MSSDGLSNDAAGPTERAIPVLTVLDLDAEVRFYRRLGFEVLHRYDGQQDGCLFLFPSPSSRAELWAALKRGVVAGTPTVRLHEIEDKPWGLRQFSVIDMSGSAIRLGTASPP